MKSFTYIMILLPLSSLMQNMKCTFHDPNANLDNKNETQIYIYIYILYAYDKTTKIKKYSRTKPCKRTNMNRISSNKML